MRIFFLICILLIVFGGIWSILSYKYGNSVGEIIYNYIKGLFSNNTSVIQIQNNGDNSKGIQIVKLDNNLEDELKFNDSEIKEMEKDIFNPCFNCRFISNCKDFSNCRERKQYLVMKRLDFNKRDFEEKGDK